MKRRHQKSWQRGERPAVASTPKSLAVAIEANPMDIRRFQRPGELPAHALMTRIDRRIRIGAGLFVKLGLWRNPDAGWNVVSWLRRLASSVHKPIAYAADWCAGVFDGWINEPVTPAFDRHVAGAVLSRAAAAQGVIAVGVPA